VDVEPLLAYYLVGCKFFTKVDLVRGYRRVHMAAMAAGNIAKITIIVSFCLFEYVSSSFRLKKEVNPVNFLWTVPLMF
jgi:hypothetical protein